MTLQTSIVRPPRRWFHLLQAESDDLLHLDALRFIAALAIVAFHFRVHVDWPQANLLNNLDGLSLAVDLFFVISGYVISYVYDGRIRNVTDYGRFLQKRVARLVPLHWATLLVFVVFGATYWLGLLQSQHPENYDPSCILPNLLLLHALGTCPNIAFNYASWSISAEMVLYVLFPIIAFLGHRPRFGLLVLVGIFVAFSLAPQFLEVRAWYKWTADFGALRAIPEFMLGAMCFRFRSTLGALPKAHLWLLAACLAFVVGMVLQINRPALLVTIYAIGIFGVAASRQGAGVVVRALAPYGQLTYSVYMLHPIVEVVVIGIVGQRLLHLHGIALNVLILGSFVLLIPLGYLSLTKFETPARRMISRLGHASRSKAPAIPETAPAVPQSSDW